MPTPPRRGAPPVFHLVLIKPTHYDDDGYPIRWVKAAIPSNTLACLNGLAEDARRRQVLGPGVDIRLSTFDETNQRVRPERIIQAIRKAGGRALIGLVGVQSNQFPRAVDLARPFRAAGLPVCIGGFHVSGTIAMLPHMTPEMVEAQQLGISLFAGEAEAGRLGQVMRDSWDGTMRPLYDYMNDLPALEAEPPPMLPPRHIRRISGSLSSLDLGRGCPYQCSFCTIINVQGRKSRFRTPDDLEKAIRENYAQGIRRFFITDDNFARNRNWEPLFDRMIELRLGAGLKIGFTIQVDTLCHRIPNFIEKAAQAGVRRVFIGLENINPDNLIGSKKHQNKITEYRAMLQKWHEYGAITCAGYIIGFPGDTKESILRDIDIIKRDLPLDVLELFYLTPLPGSEDHRTLWRDGVEMGPGPQQIRPLSSGDASPAHVRSGLGRRLSRRVGELLQLRPYPYDPAPGGGEPQRSAADDSDDAVVVQADDDVRGGPSARRRRISPQDQARATLRIPPREPTVVLSASHVGNRR
jgi:Radical SAM superfamily